MIAVEKLKKPTHLNHTNLWSKAHYYDLYFKEINTLMLNCPIYLLKSSFFDFREKVIGSTNNSWRLVHPILQCFCEESFQIVRRIRAFYNQRMKQLCFKVIRSKMNMERSYQEFIRILLKMLAQNNFWLEDVFSPRQKSYVLWCIRMSHVPLRPNLCPGHYSLIAITQVIKEADVSIRWQAPIQSVAIDNSFAWCGSRHIQ